MDLSKRPSEIIDNLVIQEPSLTPLHELENSEIGELTGSVETLLATTHFIKKYLDALWEAGVLKVPVSPLNCDNPMFIPSYKNFETRCLVCGISENTHKRPKE